MRLFLIGFVMVWGASLAMVTCAFLAMWFEEWRGNVPREAATMPEGATGRVLTADEGLLVPWSGLRASKERLGVDEAIFQAGQDERAPKPLQQAPDGSQAA